MITSDQIDSAPVCPFCGTSSHTSESCSWPCTLFRCSQCGLVYTWPLAESQSLYEEAYTENGEYNSYLHLAKKANQGEQQLMWAMRCFLKSATVTGALLDVGCSVGRFMQAAQQRGWMVTGIEISAKAGNLAKTLTGAPVHVGTITDFTVVSKFDVLTAWEVLEHIAKPVEFIQSATALLKNGGTLAISVPNWESPWMHKSLLAEHWPPYHLTYWSRDTLYRLLNEAGLTHITIKAKPFAWGEEIGNKKWLWLPVSLFRGYILNKKGMHLFATAVKQ